MNDWLADIARSGLAWMWAASTITLIVVTTVLIKRIRKLNMRRLRKLAHSERGTIYTISFALIFPIYLLLILFVGELTLLMMALMHTRFAAFAAARSAIVWSSAEPAGREKIQAQLAAAQAMVPIASGMPNHQTVVSQNNPIAMAYVPAMLSAYKKHGGAEVEYREDYLKRKIEYAMIATACTVDPDKDKKNITATVVYLAPLHFPIVGKILGTKMPFTDYYVRPITRSVTLPNERPMTPDGKLGIDYVSGI